MTFVHFLTGFVECLLAIVAVEVSKEAYWRRRSKRASVELEVAARKALFVPTEPAPKPAATENAKTEDEADKPRVYQPEKTKL